MWSSASTGAKFRLGGSLLNRTVLTEDGNFSSRGQAGDNVDVNASSDSTYRGPDRRMHRMFVTKNTEYHLRAGVCVAVRDRQSHVWLDGHLAIGRALTGTVRLAKAGTDAVPGEVEPSIGDALYFSDAQRQLVTSALCAVERPRRDLVLAYPA